MQTFDIDVTPKGINPVVYCSQKDIGRQIKFYLFDGALSYTPPANSKIFVEGRKPDNRGFSYECTYSGNEVIVLLTQQMTIFAADIPCELRVINGVNTIGTLNFVLHVEESPVNEDVPVSETEIPAIIDIAESQAQRAETSALESEGFATGKQNGVDVDSDSPYYQNNSKYYSEQAEDFKDSASESALSAANDANSANTDSLISEGFAVGKQNGVDVGSDSPYYHNSSKYYKEKCEEYVQHTPYIGANGNWWVWNVTDQIYIDSGVDASITLQIADVTMLAPDATPYVTNTGTNTDAVFHLYIPRGSGISSITKTGTSGLVDTYTITCSDGYTTTFTVTNGRDGTGTGDMLASDYDANDDVKNAGGIPDFVNYKIGTKLTQTLVAGQTTLTFTNNRITSTSLIEVYTDIYGKNPKTITQSSTTLTMTFNALSVDMEVVVIIKE